MTKPNNMALALSIPATPPSNAVLIVCEASSASSKSKLLAQRTHRQKNQKIDNYERPLLDLRYLLGPSSNHIKDEYADRFYQISGTYIGQKERVWSCGRPFCCNLVYERVERDYTALVPQDQRAIFPILPFNVVDYNGCRGKILKSLKYYQLARMCRLLGLRMLAMNRKNFLNISTFFRFKQMEVFASYLCRALAPLCLPDDIVYMLVDLCTDDPLFQSRQEQIMGIIGNISAIYKYK